LVASGILLSRILGLVRQRFFAHFFGASIAADAFTAAFRIPNFLQNLFGEGVLSASFIPVYRTLGARGDDAARRTLALATFGILALVTSLLVLGGIVAAPWLTDFIAPGFEGEKRELTVRLVRILFPGAGLFVWSAWCLGILNSHGKFFLSYAAPVVWNVAMIVTMIVTGGASQDRLAIALGWGAVLGSVLQFAVQLPVVLPLIGGARATLRAASMHVRDVVRNFVPVFIGRGVTQISAYVDEIIASFLMHGAMTVLSFAQQLYLLPVSLFGMAVSASELPELTRIAAVDPDAAAKLRQRLTDGARRITFWVVPSAVAFLALGDLIAGLVFQSGRFGEAEAIWVWGVLAGSAVGLTAATQGRLYSSAFYALRDPRTPLRFAVVRVATSLMLGFVNAILLPRALGIDPRWAVAGLTASSGLAAWLEYLLLRKALGARIGAVPVERRRLLTLWGSALVAAAVAWGARFALQPLPLFWRASMVLGLFGVVYFAITALAGIGEARTTVAGIQRRLRR
jgi:putative peptidoglycan lipid II flippase